MKTGTDGMRQNSSSCDQGNVQQCTDGDNGNLQDSHDDSESDDELADDEVIRNVAGTYYVVSRELASQFVDQPDKYYVTCPNPRKNELELMAQEKRGRRCYEDECPCAKGERCRNIGDHVTCDSKKDCKNRKGHNRWSCFEEHPKLRDRFFKAKRLAKGRGNSRRGPSRNRDASGKGDSKRDRTPQRSGGGHQAKPNF